MSYIRETLSNIPQLGHKLGLFLLPKLPTCCISVSCVNPRGAMAAHWTSNSKVVGSSPTGGESFLLIQICFSLTPAGIYELEGWTVLGKTLPSPNSTSIM